MRAAGEVRGDASTLNEAVSPRTTRIGRRRGVKGLAGAPR